MATPQHTIEVDILAQTLTLKDARGKTLIQTRISTARNGAGEHGTIRFSQTE